MQRRRRRPAPYEIYDLNRSPFSQKPTQRELAQLAKISRDELRRQASYKEMCIVRRQVEVGGKLRDLKYPDGPLRATHERFKYHLNKVKQPDYLMSPRKGKSQKDNAASHLEKQHYLTLDIKQFYPSTTIGMIKSWGIESLGLYPDVAGLFAEIATVDGSVSFGSPLTPVLVSLVHRPLFDTIFEYCEANDLSMTLWVDDLSISGEMITTDTINFLRKAIANHGLKSHKIQIRTGNRPVFITGVGIVGRHLIAPVSMHEKIRDKWDEYHTSKTKNAADDCAQSLLSLMGSVRHIVGAKSLQGRMLADRMNSLRQKRNVAHKAEVREFNERLKLENKIDCLEEEVPWLE